MDRIGDIWSFLLTLASAGLGWFLNNLWNKQEQTTKDLQDLEVNLAKNYITNEDADKISKAIFHRFDQLEKKLDGMYTIKDRRVSGD